MSTHTPTPWTTSVACKFRVISSLAFAKYGGSGSVVADVYTPGTHPHAPTDYEISAANAAFICRACNAHDELVAALEGLREAYCAPGSCTEKISKAWTLAQAALARAKEGKCLS